MMLCPQMKTGLAIQSLLAATLVACLSGPAATQSTEYPTPSATLVVPLAPGGANDLLARLVAQELEERFGKPYVVENQPAGGGIPAALPRRAWRARRLHAAGGIEHATLVQRHGSEIDAV